MPNKTENEIYGFVLNPYVNPLWAKDTNTLLSLPEGPSRLIDDMNKLPPAYIKALTCHGVFEGLDFDPNKPPLHFLQETVRRISDYSPTEWRVVEDTLFPGLKKTYRWQGKPHQNDIRYNVNLITDYGPTRIGLRETDLIHSLAVTVWSEYTLQKIFYFSPDNWPYQYRDMSTVLAVESLWHDSLEIRLGDIAILDSNHAHRDKEAELLALNNYIREFPLSSVRQDQIINSVAIFEDPTKAKDKVSRLLGCIGQYADKVIGSMWYFKYGSNLNARMIGKSTPIDRKKGRSSTGFSAITAAESLSRIGARYSDIETCLQEMGYGEENLNALDTHFGTEVVLAIFPQEEMPIPRKSQNPWGQFEGDN